MGNFWVDSKFIIWLSQFWPICCSTFIRGFRDNCEANFHYLNAYQANTTNGSVTIKGTALPILSVNPDTIDFGTTEAQKSFNISNLGGGTLNWQVTEEVPWIIFVNPLSGTNSCTVTVTISRNGLAEGDYSGIISVTSNGGDENVTASMKVFPTNYFYDDFEDGNADGWLPLNQNRWSVVQDEGDYSYFLHSTAYSGGERTWLQGYSFDSFELTLKTKSAENLNQIINATYTVHFCYQNEENYYSVKFCQYNPENKLYRKKDNQTVVLASYNGTTIDDNDYHEVKLKRDGNNIIVYFDQQQIMNAADNALSSGQIGLGAWQNSAYFDDILIKSEITEPILNVTPESINIDDQGGSSSLYISNVGGGTFTWTASDNRDWISVFPESGNPNETLTITVQPNSGMARNGTVTVTAPGTSGSPKYVQVSQDGVGNQANLWIAKDLATPSGSAITIPVNASDVTGLSIFSTYITITYDQSVFSVTGTDINGTILSSSGWGPPTQSISNGQLTLALAGSAPLSGSGVFINILANAVGNEGDSTILHFESAVFNEGDPPINTTDGLFKIKSKASIKGQLVYYSDNSKPVILTLS